MTTARAKTDGNGRFLVAGVDFNDMQDARLRNETADPSRDKHVDVYHYCVLSDFLSGVLWQNDLKMRRDHRFYKIARMLLDEGHNPVTRCMYGRKGSIKVVQIEGKEYREYKNKITVSDIK